MSGKATLALGLTTARLHTSCALKDAGSTGVEQSGQRGSHQQQGSQGAVAKLPSLVLCPQSQLVAKAAFKHVCQAAGVTTAAGTHTLPCAWI